MGTTDAAWITLIRNSEVDSVETSCDALLNHYHHHHHLHSSLKIYDACLVILSSPVYSFNKVDGAAMASHSVNPVIYRLKRLEIAI